MSLRLLAFLCLVFHVLANEENYCDPSLCDDGLTHTACDHYLEFAQDCGEDPEFVILTPHQKRLILDLHNSHRNRLASGRLPGYAPAARMPVLRWNEDLSYVAGLHARSCTTENDDCRNTKSFRNVGQNIGLDMVGEPIHNATAVIKHIIEAWFNEYKHGNQNSMKDLSEETAASMGRFVMMINDLASDIGCALVKFFKDDLFQIYFTCNYSSNNRLSQRVYETGQPCSSCNTGCHRVYSALCSPEEKINPNHHHTESITSFN